MSVNPDIHDKAYQFFIEEAAELLQIIEDGILELRRDRGANTVHAVMRAAHSIKGGAASVELEAIKAISHRMETVFRALYDETVIIDDELEGLLLDGVDCLKDPLSEQIETGSHDPEAALAAANPALEALEVYLGAEALKQADNYIPSSSDLGIDMVTSIFEIDVEEGIVRLEEVAASPENFPVLGEIQAQAEVFVGFGELLELPGFGAIAQAMLDACHNNPADPIGLLTISLVDLQAAKELVMAGDRDQGGAPSEALLALAGGGSSLDPASSNPAVELSAGDFADFGLSEADLANFDFGSGDFANADLSALTLDSAGSDSSAPEDAVLDDGLTDAGLGDLDLAALTLEGEVLLETGAVSDAQPEEGVSNETDGFDFGASDFQALMDESGDLALSEAEEDEFATVAQAGTTDLTASLEEPVMDELGADQDGGAAFDSLDAMAQLANLMAEPETSEAPAGGDQAISATEADLMEPAEFALAFDSDLESNDTPEPELDLEFEFNDLEAVSPQDLSQEDDIVAAFPEEAEADVASDDALATEVPEDHPDTIAAPDVELESMWAELGDDLGNGLGDGSDNAMDAAEDSDLDSAFDIAMDQASDVQEEQVESSLDGDVLADIFAEEAIATPAEQDVTTALSIAEADAAFEAMVDASSVTSDAFLDSEASLNLSFDDERPTPLSEAKNSTDLQEIFALDSPEDDASDIEPSTQEDASTTNEDKAALIDPWASAVIAETTPSEQEAVDSLDAVSVADSSEAAPLEEDSFAALDDPFMELFQSDDESTSATVEPALERTSEVAAEFIDEGTFVQGLEMGTLIQAHEVISSGESLPDPDGELSLDFEQQDDLDQGSITEAALTEPAKLDESDPEEFNRLADNPLEAGTFIQELDDGTLSQAMEVTPDLPLDNSLSEASPDEPHEATEPHSSESFEEGTFIQAFEEGTFIQDIAAEPSAAKALEQPPVTEEHFDQGTFVQDIEAGTFIQDIAAESSAAQSLEQPPVTKESFDEGTFVQGIEAGTFIQDITDSTEISASQDEPFNPVSDDDWDSSGDEASSEAEDSLIPELQAFIAQAAAESANSSAKPGDSKEAESNAAKVETGEPEVTEPEAEKSVLAEPEVVETDPSEAEVSEPIASLPELPEVAEAVPQESGEDRLPSLETMFSVGPERLAAIANDSIASEFMGRSASEDIQSIQQSDEPTGEATPEVTESETRGEETASTEAGEEVENVDSEAATTEAIAPTEATPLTSAAVEVALAEHQAVEPVVTQTPISQDKTEDINNAVLAVEQMFGQLPPSNQLPASQPAATGQAPKAEDKETAKAAKKKRQQGTKLSGISVRVDLSVLERMNNLVGELVLSRNSLSLQHEQLQSVVSQLDKRFTNFEGQLGGLRGISDQMLVEPAQRRAAGSQGTVSQANLSAPDDDGEEGSLLDGFDVLEMDRYSALHGQLQEIFEQLMQLEEGVDDIGVLLEQSTQSLTQQRQRLGLLQNELMWARMLPLDNILGRFPRVLRDMARKHGKSVDLNMNGTSVLVDKGMLEKLHDPMLHLLRNAFDHGIETPEERKGQGKSDRGEIQINAYYQGNQTVIEIKDDGQGVNLERIAKRAVELEWLSREEIKSIPQQTLMDLIFEPGFSTAAKLSELSGRGVGLDVVREQIKGLKGNVTVDFKKGKGTTFTLRLPLTLTVAKLMVCQVGTTAIALPSDGIEDLLVPQPEQLKMVGNKRLLHWRDDLIPIQSMAELLDYSCPTADIASLKAITAKSIPVPKDWALPLLIFSRGSQRCAMEVNRLLMEQELVIKPFSSAMTPPEYSYGCTILGDGRMIPVLDGTALLQQLSDHSMAMAAGVELSDETLDGESSDGTETTATIAEAMQADTILVVDDSTAMRRTMALSLEKAGYRVLQAGDGQEALTQLRQSSAIQLVICDVEMPNMNGFEFLSQRRREPVLMKTPVVMLTSRSSDKHRRLAMQLKAHDYFSKPYVEQDFLKSIKKILTSQGAAAKV